MSNRTVYVVPFEHIDHWNSVSEPLELKTLTDLGYLPCSLDEVANAFRAAGWDGDGALEAFWIPPFMFENPDDAGVFLWHVKQDRDGISWLCADRPYEFPGLAASSKWTPVELAQPAKPART